MIEAPPVMNRAGMKTVPSQVCISIADIIIKLQSADPELSLEIAGPASEFVVDCGINPDINITVDWTRFDVSLSGGQRLFDSGSTWQLYELDDGRREFRLAAPFSDWHPYKLARFDRDWTTGEILCQRRFFAPGQSIHPLEYPLDEVLVSNLLAMNRGVEIHGCGLVDADGRGYLFPGQSGAGKSTTARLWAGLPGVRVLSDERVILRRAGARVEMYGTPWHGDAKLSSTESAPLDQIFLLGRGPTNELKLMGKAEAAARLFSCSFPPFYSRRGLEFTLEFLDEVTQRVSCDELRFVPDRSMVQFIRERAAAKRSD
jgi:hypothetical protein